MDASSKKPAVSIIMANFNGARYIEDAIVSVLGQTFRDFELIIADDASTDDSVAVVRRRMTEDDRIRLLVCPRNGGPAAARNFALNNVRGEWIAVIDSDDLIHPERLETLLKLADQDQADVVADDLLIFDSGFSEPPRTLLHGAWATDAFWVDTPSFIRSNLLYGRLPALGYCKPLIKRAALGDIRYNENLKIGEDYDLLLRLLVRGVPFRIYPRLLYFYRKHTGSISHRLNEQHCMEIEIGEQEFRRDLASKDAVWMASVEREASARRALKFARLVAAIKSGSPSAALTALFRNREAIPLLNFPVLSALQRVGQRARALFGQDLGKPGICIISRQRIVGQTNGSSAYVLSIASYLKANGYRIHLLSPSPLTFGRWPFMRLSPEMKVFDTVTIRGSWHVGNVLIARNPRVISSAIATLVDRILVKLKLYDRPKVHPAPYAIAAPLQRDDQLFLSARIPRLATKIIFDYAFLTAARPYTLLPSTTALVIMHDLFSARGGHFRQTGIKDATADLDIQTEIALLNNADYIVAIQKAEAATIAEHGASKPIIVAPMAVPISAASDEGKPDTLLFVGSKAAPNVDGLTWFLTEVWPSLSTSHPNLRLNVVGSVCESVNIHPRGVSYLGLVPDLEPFYQAAGVVVSPLRVGSGLKIKLVEAMAHGKAVVATTTTLQGMEKLAGHAVRVADTASEFIASIDELVQDHEARAALGRTALSVAQRTFAPEVCYGDIRNALGS